MKTDVLIIGGGAIGASVAYFLKLLDPSIEIIVVERDPTYERASTPRASGGIRRLFSLPENIELSNYSISFFDAFEDDDRKWGEHRHWTEEEWLSFHCPTNVKRCLKTQFCFSTEAWVQCQMAGAGGNTASIPFHEHLRPWCCRSLA